MTELILTEIPLIDKLQQVAEREQTTVDAMLIQAVTEFLSRKGVYSQAEETEEAFDSTAVFAAFEQEVKAFEQGKAKLLQEYPGKVVAIYQGQVVAVGDDRLKVHNEVIEKYGNVPCYIENVVEETPSLIRITSSWKVQ